MISAIVWVVRFLARIVPFLVNVPRMLSFVYKFVKVLAFSPLAFIIVPLIPVLDTIMYILTGHSLGIGNFFSGLMRWVLDLLLNKIMASITMGGQDITELWQGLPQTVLELSCYLGISEALQILVNGIASALSVLITLQIGLFITRSKFSSLFSRRR